MATPTPGERGRDGSNMAIPPGGRRQRAFESLSLRLNTFVAQNWTVALGFKEEQAWRPWTVDGQQAMGGYVTRYAHNYFDFLTIRGAGHMVPEFKPKAALEFLTRFLRNEDYKPYKPPARVAKGEL